jgi:hypothetical protein
MHCVLSLFALRPVFHSHPLLTMAGALPKVSDEYLGLMGPQE